jgi:hypothetical protein
MYSEITQNVVLTTDQHITWKECHMKLSLGEIFVGWNNCDHTWKTKTLKNCFVVNYFFVCITISVCPIIMPPKKFFELAFMQKITWILGDYCVVKIFNICFQKEVTSPPNHPLICTQRNNANISNGQHIHSEWRMERRQWQRNKLWENLLHVLTTCAKLFITNFYKCDMHLLGSLLWEFQCVEKNLKCKGL